MERSAKDRFIFWLKRVAFLLVVFPSLPVDGRGRGGDVRPQTYPKGKTAQANRYAEPASYNGVM